MRKAACIVLVVACFCAAFFNRIQNAEERIAHADESEQASVFLKLYSQGEYKYNPNGPHGPTLYYFADTINKLVTEAIPDDITIVHLRRSIIPFSLAIMAMFLIFAPFIGRSAAWGAVVVFALSTTSSLYSQYFVHEIIFAFAILGLAQAIWHFVARPSFAPVIAAGAFAAIAQCTKETAALAYPALGVGFLTVCIIDKTLRKHTIESLSCKNSAKYCATFLGVFVAIFLAFYSSFGSNWEGVINAFTSYGHFLTKAGAVEHSSGFLYYFKLLTLQKCEGVYFGELPIFALSILGFVLAIFDYTKRIERLKALCAIFMFVSAATTILILSFITYKTPWLILSPITLMCITAGYAIKRILSVRGKILWCILFFALCALAYCQYNLNSKALLRYDSDPRNPFIYAHTVKDFNNLIDLIKRAASLSEYESDIPVAFVTKTSPWPAPWYLRKYDNIGYWENSAPENIDVYDIVICDQFSEPDLLKRLDKSKYASNFYGIRKNLILIAYIKKKLFEDLTKE